MITRQFVSRARLVENLRLFQDSNLRELLVSMTSRSLPGNWKDIVDSKRPVLFCLIEDDVVHPVRLGNMLDVKSYPNRLECRISCQEFVSNAEPGFQSWFDGNYHYPPILDAISLPDEMLSFSENVSGEYWHHVSRSLCQLESCSNTVFWRVIGIEGDETSQLILDLENKFAAKGSHRKQLQIIDSDTGDIIKQVDAERSHEVTIEMPSLAMSRCYEIASYPIRHSSLMEKIEIPPCIMLPSEQIETRDSKVDKNDWILQKAVRKLWEHIDRQPGITPETRVEFLSHYVVPSFPKDVDLVEDLAKSYLEIGRPEEAYNQLRCQDLNHLSNNGAMMLFEAATAVRADYSYENLIPLIDLQTHSQMIDFVKAVEQLGESQAMQVLECLANTDVLLFVQVIGFMSEGYFTEPANILRFVGYLELCLNDPPNPIFRYLVNQCERHPHLVTNPQFLKLYIDYGEKSNEPPNEDFIKRAVKRCVQDNNTEMAVRFVELAKKRFAFEAFEHVMEDTYRDLCSGDTSLRILAAQHVLDIVDTLINTCLLEDAAMWLNRLIATFGEADPLVERRMSRLQDRLNDAIKGTEFYEDYQAYQKNGIYTKVKGILSDKILVVVGGWKPKYAGKLKEGLGLKELMWYECERNQRFDAKPVREALRHQHCCGLLYITSHMGHDVEKALESACRDLPVAKSSLGERAILDALAKTFL